MGNGAAPMQGEVVEDEENIEDDPTDASAAQAGWPGVEVALPHTSIVTSRATPRGTIPVEPDADSDSDSDAAARAPAHCRAFDVSTGVVARAAGGLVVDVESGHPHASAVPMQGRSSTAQAA